MNKPLVTSLIVSATAFIGRTSVANDVFDSPGPGYRQQLERAFPTTTKDVPIKIRFGAPIIHVVPTSFATPTLPSPPFPTTTFLELNNLKPTFGFATALSPFFAPIRFSIDNSVAAPIRGEEKKPK
jgi:hypothetical protein